MSGSSFTSGVSGRGQERVMDLGGYLLVFKRRMKLYDANPDEHRFYEPFILLDFLNHKMAGPFYEEVKAIQAILKEELWRYGRYHALVGYIINKQFDPLVDYDEEMARWHIELIRNTRG